MAFLTPFIFGIVTGGVVVYRWVRRARLTVEADGSNSSVDAKDLARHLPTPSLTPESPSKKTTSEETTSEETTSEETTSEETTSEETTGAKAVMPVTRATGVQWRPAADDFTSIAGIGPLYAARLNAAGIHTFVQLAALTPKQVAEIVIQGDIDRLVDTRAWVAQAQRLRARRKEQTDYTLDCHL